MKKIAANRNYRSIKRALTEQELLEHGIPETPEPIAVHSARTGLASTEHRALLNKLNATLSAILTEIQGPSGTPVKRTVG